MIDFARLFPADGVERLVVAVMAAEAAALAAHEAGTCHLSEWSCSHCEAERDGAPCCPDPGCSGNPCGFPGYAESH